MLSNEQLMVLRELLLQSSIRQYQVERDPHEFSPRRRVLTCRLSQRPRGGASPPRPIKSFAVLEQLDERRRVQLLRPAPQLLAEFGPGRYSDGHLTLRHPEVNFVTFRKLLTAANGPELLQLQARLDGLRQRARQSEAYVRRLAEAQASMRADFLDYQRANALISRIRQSRGPGRVQA